MNSKIKKHFSHHPAFTLVEVVVMMVILSVALVGIYSLVNSGQRLASQSDNRLVAVNIARAGLEGVTSLRDTSLLQKFSANRDCFFSIDGEVLPGKCLDINSQYILLDDGTLASSADFSVCINENGWYSQENSTS